MRAPDPLAVAVRAYTVAHATPVPTASDRRGRWSLPEHVLVFDCETTTDYSQRLNFGSWRYYRAEWGDDPGPRLRCVEEGLFYADDLPARDPAGYRALLRYAETTAPDVDRSVPDAAWRMKLIPAREFAEHVIVQFGFKARAWIVGFNLPFDLSRIALNDSESRDYLPGGFSLTLAQYLSDQGWQENRWRNRVAIKTLDSKRQLIGFKRRVEADASDRVPEGETTPEAKYAFRGHFLDLRTLAFAITNESYTLQAACEAFGVEESKTEPGEHGRITRRYIDYNRHDVRATAALFARVMAEYRHHPIQLSPTKAYSPATVGKAYLRAMGVQPRLKTQPDFPPELLGRGMVAYYGGRAECRIRRTAVPVVYVDFLSMYPTVNSLMGLWDLVTADRIEAEDATEDVTAMLDDLSVDDCFRPETWRQFVGLVEIEPDGDVLPVRARYGATNSWGIGLNPLTSDQPLWYSIPDVIAAKLLTGRAPRIRTAIRLTGHGRTPGLRPTRLRGAVSIDPRSQDFFRTVIEERHRLKQRTDLTATERDRLDPFLKVLANSASYGIYAEMNRQDLPGGKIATVDVHGLGDHPFTDTTSKPEAPGEFAFPPMAACITGAARLMLALLEHLVVEEAGGNYAFCDTDSMAIVATEHGGHVPCQGGGHHLPNGTPAVRALTWLHVDRICDRFADLNPYDRTAVPGSVLEVEDENYTTKSRKTRRQLYCHAISAKRYALYTLNQAGDPILRPKTKTRPAEKWSEHGLGHLLNPVDPNADDRDWIRQLWQHELLRSVARPSAEPSWLDRPAIGRISITKQQTLEPFRTFNGDNPYPERVKPFNFLLTAQLTSLTSPPPGADPLRFQLLAPFESDPRKWLELDWRDKYLPTAPGYRLSTSDAPNSASGTLRIQSFRDVLADYRIHPEPKSVAPDGGRSGWHSTGLLQRRPVAVARLVHIGKESNEVDEIRSGTVHAVDEALNEYVNVDTWCTYVLPILTELSRADLRDLGLSGTQIRAIRLGSFRPLGPRRTRLTQLAARRARQQFPDGAGHGSNSAVDCCAAYITATRQR